MNYAAHNQELHGTLKRPDEPVIFTKADSAILNQGKPFFIPDHLGRIDYETEIVVRICRLGKNIPERFAHRYYDALTVGIDFTARDLQKRASEAGQPWTICKGFDGSAAIGEWVPKEKLLSDPEAPCADSGLQRLQFHLDINGQTVQEGCTSDMLYRVDEIIAYISKFFTLKTGRHSRWRRSRPHRRPPRRLSRRAQSARLQLQIKKEISPIPERDYFFLMFSPS